MKTATYLTLATILLATGPRAERATADGMIVVHNPPALPAARYAFAPLEVSYHRVTVTIRDQVAVTEVDQSFYNPHNQRMEGTYMFPVPAGAQIDKFSMDIDGKRTEAELLDAGKARKIYEDIVRQMKDPALLEYAGQSMVKVRIFPIEPHSDKHIQLRYTQVLRKDGGMLEYLYPLNTEKFSAAPLKSVAVKVDVQCGQDIHSLYSPSHTVDVKRHDARHAVVGYEASNVTPDTDFRLYFTLEARAEFASSVTTFNDGKDAEGGYFLLMLEPGAAVAADKAVDKDVVFVLDTSGSMADSHKLVQAGKALTLCLQNLRGNDRFDVVRFSTEAEPLFGKLVPADEPNRTRAEAFLRDMKPIGGTAIEEALTTALRPLRERREPTRPYMVVFITDGRPTVGKTDEDAILAAVKRESGDQLVRVFCLGIGTDVNTHLLDRLTENTHAVGAYVLPEEDIELKVSAFCAKISEPVLTNPRMRFSDAVTVSKLYPQSLPDVFRGEQLIVLGRYKGHGDAAFTLEGDVNGKPRTFTHEATFPAEATTHDFVPRLWGARRVGYLLDQIRLHGENAELRDEVATLARRYAIVTPYTAYLIVEDEARRNIPMAQRTLQEMNRNAPARAQATRMSAQFRAEKSGDSAVGNSRAFDALKNANVETVAASANTHAWRGQTGQDATDVAPLQKALAAQQTRNVAGRTFYQNGSQWVDAEVQTRQNARTIQVKFNSQEYFALIDRHAKAGQWLSVGRNVQLVLDDAVYEIID